MKIFKKILGIVLLVLAILLCFPAFYAFPIQFETCKKKFEDGVAGAPGYTIGFLTCLLVYLLLTYYLIKLSLKLIRKKKINTKLIDEIGMEDN